MATEKIINTRIQLKYDTLANWNTNNPVLRAGEVGLATITVADGNVNNVPTVLLKVGDGASTWSQLKYAYAQAADVYAWAKQAKKPTYTHEEVGAAATAHTHTVAQITDFADEVNKLITIGVDIPEYTIESTEDGSITLKKDNVVVGKAVKINGWDELVATADNALKASDIDSGKTNGTISVKGTEVAVTGLGSAAYTASTAYATAAQGELADTAVQTVKTGTENGTIAVDGKNVTVAGLGSAAYTASSAYATAEQGRTADNAMPKSGGQATGTITFVEGYTTTLGRDPVDNMEATTKKYVDAKITTEIGKIDQFKYTISTGAATTPKDIVWYNDTTKVTGTLVASADTEYNIYLVPCKHSAAQEQEGYDEYLTVKTGSIYRWEVLGNTRDIDLSQYVNGISGTANNGVITNISKNGNTITVTSKSLETADPNVEAGDTIAFIKSISQAADGKITAHKQNVPIATKTQLGLVKAGATSGKVYGVDVATDGAMTVNVPWENTQNDNTWRPITLGGTAYKAGDTNSGALDLRSGNNISIGIDTTDANKGVKISAKNQTVKVGTTTFGADDAVEIKAGTNVSVVANTTNKTITINGKSDTDIDVLIKAHKGVDKVGTVTSVKATPNGGLKVAGTATDPTIEIDDSVVFVFNCGSATKLVD